MTQASDTLGEVSTAMSMEASDLPSEAGTCATEWPGGDVVLPEGVHWNSSSRWIVLFAGRGANCKPGEGEPYYYRPSRPAPGMLSRSQSFRPKDDWGDEDSETEWDPPAEGVCGLGHAGHVWMFDTHV